MQGGLSEAKPTLFTLGTFFHIIQMHQTVCPADQLSYALHAQFSQDPSQLVTPRQKHVDNSLCPPIKINQIHQLRIRCGNTPGTPSSAFAIVAPDTLQRHQVCRPCAYTIRTQRYDLGNIVGCPDPAACDHGNFIANPLFL